MSSRVSVETLGLGISFFHFIIHIHHIQLIKLDLLGNFVRGGLRLPRRTFYESV
jgi:hypothetical protein